MKFKKIVPYNNKGASFDLKESTTKAGKKYVYYDVIQAAREDTEIIPTLKKYGCLDPIMVNKEQMYLDIRELKNTDMRSLQEYTRKANEMWNQLPGEIKAKFENNKDIFLKDGEKWLKSELDKANAPKPKTILEEQAEQPKGE